MAFSVNSPIGDGVTTQFAVSFTNGLYSRDNVHVFVGDETTERAFTWINDGLIDVQGTVPAVGEVVTIRRIMDKTNKAVDFADGEILDERNLDTMVDQLYNIAHEFLDGYGLTEINTDVDMRGNSLTNVGGGDPNDPGSLATIGDLQNAIVSPEDLVDAVRISNNFSDLDDTAVCRTNLDVYSKAEVQEVTQSNANTLINGDFQVWQRGTSFSNVDNMYTADRWLCDAYSSPGDSSSVSREPFTPGQSVIPLPNNPEYYLHYVRNQQGSSDQSVIRQRIENLTMVQGMHTLSYWAYSDKNITLSLNFVRRFSGGGSTDNQLIEVTHLTGWNYYEHQVDIGSLSGQTIGDGNYLEIAWVDFAVEANGAFTFDIANVKFEKGSVATPFESEPYGDVLAKCQRYYEKQDFSDKQVFFASGQAVAATAARLTLPYETVKRTNSPTITSSSAGSFFVNAAAGNSLQVTSLSFDSAGNKYLRILADVSSGLVTGNATIIKSDGNADRFIAIDAEL